MVGAPRHRRLILLRGAAEQTRAEARRLLASIPLADRLWVSEGEADEPGRRAPAEVQKLLGLSFDALALDLHEALGGLEAELLGQAQGLLRGGGAMILRLPPEGAQPTLGGALRAPYPYLPADLGGHLRERLERALSRAPQAPAEPLSPAPRAKEGSGEQAEAVARLARLFASPSPRAVLLLSDRGRGKSSALGLALGSALRARGPEGGLRVAVSADQASSVREIFRFALGDPEPKEEGPLRYLPPAALLASEEAFDLLVLDEAAQLPVPLLKRLVRRREGAHLAFATTARGYEGTGRGFLLRFLGWLREQRPDLVELRLREPIRWDRGDPLEAFVHDALLLDAEPSRVEPSRIEGPPLDPRRVEALRLDREALAADEATLRAFFGLLVHAHYRTTPRDLARLLDAPNLHLHALRCEGAILGATWVAEEGELPEAIVEELYWGGRRLLGHALPESLIGHLGHREAGPMKIRRSVRIAIHPSVRRRGLGRRLVEHAHRAHASEAPDLFGTLFGATAELLAFRRSVGYELVRLGASRGSRTGEPAALMLRPLSERGRALFAALRAELARDLPLQLRLLEGEGELLLDPGLRGDLFASLPEAAPLDGEAVRASVAAYAFGPRIYESAASSLEVFVERHRSSLSLLEASERALIEGRVCRRESWARLTREGGLGSPRVAMRALRRALRALTLKVAPELERGA